MATRIPFTFNIDGSGGPREETLAVELPGVIKIGKLESSHLRIEDEGVSKMHAIIEISESGEAWIMDLGSSAGTILNGAPVKKTRLEDGGVLVLGSTRISVSVGAPLAEPHPLAVATEPDVAVAPLSSALPVGGAADQMSAPANGDILSGLGQIGSGPAPGSVLGPPAVAAWRQPAMPAGPPPADPSLDRQDGSQAIEVTAMFNDDVLLVRHLDNPAAGKVTPLTWLFIGIGWGIFVLAFALAASGQTGFSGLLFVVGLGFGVYGLIRRGDERRSPDFVLGAAPEADLNIVNPAIPDARFPLVKSDGQQYSLLLTESMSGDVTRGAERIDLRQLVSTGQARPLGTFAGTFAYAIPKDARIKLDIGQHTLLVNSVAPARSVTTSWLARLDWAAQTSNGLSFAAHAILLFLVFAVPPDAKSLSLDLFDADNRFVKYLVKPPEQKEEDVPAWLKKKGPDKAGGKGQRHKGEEGKMGKKTSKKKTGLYGLKGPKDNPDPHLAKRLAEETAQTAGVLGILGSSGGSHIASIFGRDTALGTDAEDALGGLIGDRIGEAYGLGGLGLVGTGRGGGGTGEGTIGLGALGTIGKGGGGGEGAGYGRGAGHLGGRSARAPRVVAGQAEVRGSLDKEIIRRIIRRHINEVKYCYAKELQADERLGGRVVTAFTIAANGQVVVSNVQSSTLGNRAVEQCIAQAVRRWLFPKPKGGGIVHVSYPFVLRPAGG